MELDGARRVRELAIWWTQATNEERWLLLRRTIDIREKAKAAHTIDELRVAIILAETEAGEIEKG